MRRQIAIIGFGEAGRAFAEAGQWGAFARAFDIRGVAHQAVLPCTSAREALSGAEAVLSLVTADQALAAASRCEGLPPGALWLDMNSVAPDSKRAAAKAIGAAGGRYVDVAIMAPVQPAALAVPLLLSGQHADGAADCLRHLGFSNVTIAGSEVGQASTIKMLRSVMIKGMEALTAECLIGAAHAGVVDEVLAALGADLSGRADYNLDRMMAHGLRRAAEMDEVAATLEGLGTAPLMTRAAAARQRAIGMLASGQVPAGLAGKLSVLVAA